MTWIVDVRKNEEKKNELSFQAITLSKATINAIDSYYSNKNNIT